jgi:hypothetical protein
MDWCVQTGKDALILRGMAQPVTVSGVFLWWDWTVSHGFLGGVGAVF